KHSRRGWISSTRVTLVASPPASTSLRKRRSSTLRALRRFFSARSASSLRMPSPFSPASPLLISTSRSARSPPSRPTLKLLSPLISSNGAPISPNPSVKWPSPTRKAAYYPSLVLYGQGGWNAADISQLLNAASAFWAVGANLAQDIFTGGARHAQAQFSQAGYDAAIAAYRGTVLNAFREVQDNLSGLQVLDAARQSQADAVDSSRRQLDIATSRYTGGLVSYLDVVSAQQNLLNNEQEAAIIQGQRLVTSVLLV